MLVLLLACSSPPVPPPEPAVPPAAEPRAVPAPIADVAAATALLSGPLEAGACRKGAVRSDGVVRLDAKNPAHVPLLLGALDGPTEAAALAAGVLWDARGAIPAERAPRLVETLLALHRLDAFPAGRCRTLTPVEAEGMLWNARADLLALLARDTPEPARTQARDTLVAQLPELADPLKAAFGDEDAVTRLANSTLAELCAGRTWTTTWTLRAMDTGRPGASMAPLTAFENHKCPGPAR